MYWGDAGLDKIERANLDGTGRTILLSESGVHYFAFLLHGRSIYFTDWGSRYALVLIFYRQRNRT